MRQWLSKHHFCSRFFGSSAKEVTEDYILEIDSDEDEDNGVPSISVIIPADSGKRVSESDSNNSNPLFDDSNNFSNLRDSVIDGPKVNKKSAIKSKGILITQSQSNTPKDNSIAFSIDLDRDRFVRFGE
jgi:hypothetical protein